MKAALYAKAEEITNEDQSVVTDRFRWRRCYADQSRVHPPGREVQVVA